MFKNTRKPIIVGNWKMNNDLSTSFMFERELIKLLKKSKVQNDIDFAIAPSFLSLPIFSNNSKKISIPLAAQNVHYEQSGAFTGEVSLEMLKDYEVKYIIVGHSERRQMFNETNETINKKIKTILGKSNISPILAFGETEAEFNKKETIKVVEKQLKEGLKDITKDGMEKIILAYEPIWAIGTGKTATTIQAQSTIKSVRDIIKNMFDEVTAQKVRIQYGGSVNPKNIKELMRQPDIDGALVGGASLTASSFYDLLTFKKEN